MVGWLVWFGEHVNLTLLGKRFQFRPIRDDFGQTGFAPYGFRHRQGLQYIQYVQQTMICTVQDNYMASLIGIITI